MVLQFPPFFPDQTKFVKSTSTLQFIQRYERSGIHIPSLKQSIETAFIPPTNSRSNRPPICFLHGFDSSSLDFREVIPLIETDHETWAVDLIGWGFSDNSVFLQDPSLPAGPDVKADHLFAFWKEKIGRPMVLLGVSLGGAVAIDFAIKHPEAVKALVLSSSQGYIDGLGLLSKLPTAIARLGVFVLQTEPLRETANKMAYYSDQIDIKDAMIIGRLHTFLPGWTEASLSFIRSGGYSLSSKISSIECPTLVLWGRQDEVLGTDAAYRFEGDIKSSKLIWIEDCGHASHIEKAPELTNHLLTFLETRF